MRPVLAALAVSACAHATAGERRVIERDLGDFAFRRFQKVEDIEFRVEGNPGVGWTAVYQRKDTLGRATVPHDAIAIAFVTEYERPGVRIDPAWLQGYRIKREKNVVVLTGAGDVWTLWPSSRFIVKVGQHSGRAVPDELVTAYRDAYPPDASP